ncbi:hypothetical protein Sinac_4303 [Singulisphaera acidiphila DSM 18658]|uniref:Uncharacterized protein n=1 Tax=Singulisphaera acidiphila (strain ATCC BAA-1392 / DSM 18658 / VKM B-2454 / MOB10) TaxID=886293 RepID=L0DGW1_SINAD|nr:hypothetical protein Sinac_4303 [Singulisphaera acidiphila DSM 18658]
MAAPPCVYPDHPGSQERSSASHNVCPEWLGSNQHDLGTLPGQWAPAHTEANLNTINKQLGITLHWGQPKMQMWSASTDSTMDVACIRQTKS